MSRNMIKEAEQNCVNIAKEMTDMLEVLDGLRSFGNNFLEDYGIDGKKEYFEGLQMMRRSIYNKYLDMISRCFMLADVGGGEAKKYSREQFNKYFNGDTRYTIMHFLDRYGRTLASYNTKEDEEFRRQAGEVGDK